MASHESIGGCLEALKGLSEEDIKHDEQARKRALQSAKALVSQLSDPNDVALELAYSPFFPMAARLAVDLDLFTLLAYNSQPMSTKELSSTAGADPVLVSRLLRTLASVGFVSAAGTDLYSATAITVAMSRPATQACYRLVWDNYASAAVSAQKFFRRTRYQLGSDQRDCLIQYAHQTKLPFFQFLSNTPETLRDFNAYMGNLVCSRRNWVDWYPVREAVLDGYRPKSPLIVDIGGGKGHDLEIFHNKHPKVGRLILQELAAVVNSIGGSGQAFECQAHDFFNEQPAKGK